MRFSSDLKPNRKSFFQPASMPDRKVVSIVQMLKNGATCSLDNLELSVERACFFLSGKSFFSKGHKEVFMLIGFWDNFLITFTGRRSTRVSQYIAMGKI